MPALPWDARPPRGASALPVCRGQRPPIAPMLSLAMMLIKPALLSYPGMLIVSLLASGYRTWAPRLADVEQTLTP